jgi:hypothetical protein
MAAVKAHEFPKTSLHPVAHHRVAHATAYAETKPRSSGVRLMEKNDEKVRTLPAFAASLNPQEFPSSAQTEILSESRSTGAVRLGCRAGARFALTRRAHSLSPRGLRWHLDGQPLPALATASFQHVLPSGCRHTREEAVRPLPTQVTRLVRALHPLLFLSGSFEQEPRCASSKKERPTSRRPTRIVTIPSRGSQISRSQA